MEWSFNITSPKPNTTPMLDPWGGPTVQGLAAAHFHWKRNCLQQGNFLTDQWLDYVPFPPPLCGKNVHASRCLGYNGCCLFERLCREGHLGTLITMLLSDFPHVMCFSFSHGCSRTLSGIFFGLFTKSSVCQLRVKDPQLRYDPLLRALIPGLSHKQKGP